MNNYYFTADKWYGPYNGESGYKVFLLPSGPSSIPEFAGMVKEEGKDFKWKYQCPACGGDGKETCNNPDHNFIQAVLREIGRLGCPVCGHDPDHKVNGGKNVCPECGGYGLVIPEVFEEYGREYGYDEEPIQTAVPVAEEFKYLNERAKNIPKETRLEVSKMMDKLDAEEGFSKDEMQRVQDDIDSVMKGKVVDKAKLIGISAIGNDELCDIIQNACQLINGFKLGAVEENYWSDWDESVLQSLIEILRRLQPVYGKQEGKQTFSEEQSELEYLRRWKKEAMDVMPDFQAIGKEIGAGLGESVHDKILPFIIKLKKENEKFKTEYLKTKQ